MNHVDGPTAVMKESPESLYFLYDTLSISCLHTFLTQRVADPRCTGTLTELKQHPEGGGYRALKPAGFAVWGALVKAALIRTDGRTAGETPLLTAADF